MIVERCAFPIDFPKLAQWIVAHIDGASSEGQVRRDRLKWVLNLAIDLYRDTLREQLGLQCRDSLDLSAEPANALAQRVDSSGWVRLIQRTQEAREQVDRNVSPAALIEAWSTDNQARSVHPMHAATLPRRLAQMSAQFIRCVTNLLFDPKPLRALLPAFREAQWAYL